MSDWRRSKTAFTVPCDTWVRCATYSSRIFQRNLMYFLRPKLQSCLSSKVTNQPSGQTREVKEAIQTAERAVVIHKAANGSTTEAEKIDRRLEKIQTMRISGCLQKTEAHFHCIQIDNNIVGFPA
jgi:hypothetical protein